MKRYDREMGWLRFSDITSADMKEAHANVTYFSEAKSYVLT